MVDFVGQNPGLADDMRQWSDYWTADHARAQQAYLDREARNRYDEANRLRLDEATSARAFRAQNAGLFDSADASLAGLSQQNAPVADLTNGRDPSTLTRGLRIPGRGSNTATPNVTGTDVALPNSNGWQDPVVRPEAVEPVRSFSELTPEQSRAVGVYWHMTQSSPTAYRTLSPQERQAALSGLRAVGLDVRNGGIVRRTGAYTRGQLRFPAAGQGTGTSVSIPPATSADIANAPSIPSNTATNDPGLATDTSTPAPMEGPPDTTTSSHGLEPPNAYQGTNDTSRALRPTREMQQLEFMTRDRLRAADIASAHGDNATADAAFAQALQSQAAYTGQYRTQLYHAAAAGNNDAMTTLFSEFAGVPANAVRLQPTNESRTRFNLQIDTDGTGHWVTSNEVPQTRQEILAGLQNLVDAGGAAARTEANTRYALAQQDAGVRLTIAAGERDVALRRILGDVLIHQLDNASRQALQAGQGHVYIDPDGGALWEHTVIINGQPQERLEHVTAQQVRTANVDDGNATTRAYVAENVTGIPGVTAGTQ